MTRSVTAFWYSSCGISFSNWDSGTSHGFRRGSAQEYYERGSSLSAILTAGGWRSGAYLTYLQKEKLDTDKLFEALASAERDEGDA